ncbi:hypothetical protein [Actinomadura macrotermitis]|uniref:DNA-directed RNA polymerase specialized sigma subunit, sigma24 family n=1 Tax=Actinomadura macrotermitis TaxID=2585200 RepID=A0A7K0C7X7_9ACTN|nr:hypothetical protein [Actinomadura macrotermitis]MQY09569.1 hypothetical protein [Actinomadura macrotermitis]
MPEQVTTEPVAEARYCDLVWLAYLVLPGNGKRVYRLAIARRIADGVTARRSGGPGRRRTRVLRKAMQPSRRLQIGLGPWLRALPARLPDQELTAALAQLDPQVRAAYVLLRIIGESRYQVRDQLAEAGVRRPWPVIEAAEALPVIDTGRLEPFEPGRMRPVRRRSPIPVAAAGVLTAGLVGALIVTETDGSFLGGRTAAAGPRLDMAAPGAWRSGGRGLDDWPARGDLVTDRAFTRRALQAWASAAGTRRPGRADRAQLLFAGHVDGTPVAVLRNGDRIARYSGASGALEAADAGDDAAAPVALGGDHYLLAPWDTAAALPGGRGLRVSDGMTEPVPLRSRCGRGPLMDVKSPGGTRTVGALGGPRPAVLGYRPPGRRAAAAEVRPARLSSAGRRLWGRLACALPQAARPATEAVAAEFWTGTLPHGGRAARWICTRTTFPGGGATGESALLTGRDAYSTGGCDERRPVAGTWWRSPAGRWYYIAAAGRGLAPDAEGVRSPEVTKRLLVAEAPDPKVRPENQVRLTAHSG